MKELKIRRDGFGQPTFSIDFSDSKWSATLVADADTTVTVPTNASIAMFSGTDEFFVANDAAAAYPAAGTFAETDSELGARVRNVDEVTTLHFMARTAIDLTVTFYAGETD